jgi:ATP phosphoribosyltransferase regulatory subunit
VGLGDAALYPAMLDGYGVRHEAREPLMRELVTRDFVGLEREVAALGLGAEATARLVRVPQLRGGPEVLEEGGEAVAGLAAVHRLLDPDVAARVIFDLGLIRGLGYYTGAVFDVYDPALGRPLGGGGRYDDLLGRFGRALPAVGFALNVEPLHIALMGEERR